MLFYEFYKLKRRYVFFLVLFLALMPCFLQSFAGYLETSIPWEVLYITGLDLFGSIIFPSMAGIVVSMMFYFDEEHQGMLPLMLCGASPKKYLWSKWVASVFICELWFLSAYLVTFLFTLKRGGSIVVVLAEQLPYLICSGVMIVLLVNLGFLWNLVFHSPLVSALIGVLLSVLGLLFSDTLMGRVNPYGYLNRFIVFREMEGGDFLCAGSILVLSLLFVFAMVKKEGRMGYAREKR